MSMDDLSYFQALIGGGPDETAGAAGGVWVVDPDGWGNDGILRLVGKARVVADALGCYVYLLACGSPAEEAASQAAIHAGADSVLTARGIPALADLTAFFGERAPQAILFSRTTLGRTLGPGLAQALGGGLCGHAVDLAFDSIYQRVIAHQPVLDNAARQSVAILASPAVVVVDTEALPAAYNEPWRSGHVEDTGFVWTPAPEYPIRRIACGAADAGERADRHRCRPGAKGRSRLRPGEEVGRGARWHDRRRLGSAGRGVDWRGPACWADRAQRRAEAIPCARG